MKKRPRLLHDKTGAGGFIANIPRQIKAESNPRYAHLAGFPLNILSTILDPPAAANALPGMRGACYWPDFGSYREDADTRELRYLPRQESPYSVVVIHDRATGAWTVRKYRDAAVVWEAHGADFRTAMMHATMVGVAHDEPTDDGDDQGDS